MAHDITASYVTKFDEMVKHAYQEMGGKLRSTVHNRTGVTGEKHTFNVYGVGFAKDAPTGGNDMETMGSKTSKVTVDLEEKQASELSNIFENDKVHIDDETELVDVIAKALGRTEDQFIIDSLVASTIPSENIIAMDFGSTGTDSGLTVAKVIEASVALDDQGVDAEGRFFVAPTKAKRQLLASEEVNSIDYNNVKALTSGQVNEFMGFTFVWIADTLDVDTGDKYGLPGVGTTDRKCYAYQKDAVALAVGNLDKQTRIDYVPLKAAHLVASFLRAGAGVREVAGVVEVNVVV